MAFLGPPFGLVGGATGLAILTDPSLSRVSSATVGFLYPSYASFKAIKSREKGDDTQWLTYWVVNGLITFVETCLDRGLTNTTLYNHGKLAFLLWLQLPQTRGAQRLFDNFIAPFLTKHEDQIDDLLDKAKQSGARVTGL